jgi:lipoprotein signal peptidase
VVHRSPLPTLPVAIAVGVFAAADLVVDRLVGDQPSTYHHVRPAALVIPALVLGTIAWLTRAKLPTLGQLGIGLSIAGAAGNAACLLFDPAGVSDYLPVRVGDYLIVLNVADVVMLTGLALVVVSALQMAVDRLTATAS